MSFTLRHIAISGHKFCNTLKLLLQILTEPRKEYKIELVISDPFLGVLGAFTMLIKIMGFSLPSQWSRV